MNGNEIGWGYIPDDKPFEISHPEHEISPPILTIKPSTSKRVQLDLSAILRNHIDSEKHTVNFSICIEFKLKQGTRWAKANHLIAWQQFYFEMPKAEPARLGSASLTPTTSDISEPLIVEEGVDQILVRNKFYEFVIAKNDASIRQFKMLNDSKKAESLILGGPQLNIWRAPTDICAVHISSRMR